MKLYIITAVAFSMLLGSCQKSCMKQEHHDGQGQKPEDHNQAADHNHADHGGDHKDGAVKAEGHDEKAHDAAQHQGEHGSVYFASPANNAHVSSPVKVAFGVKGMKIRPALEDVHDKSSGHYHVLVDHPRGFIDKGQPIPMDDRHIHYNKGETSASIELAPGIHKLSLQLSDGAHISYGKDMSSTITVTVLDKAH